MLKLIKNFSKFESWEDINKVIKNNAKEAGFIKGVYVVNNKTGKASKIDSLLTSTFAIGSKQDCAMAYLNDVYQDYVDIKNLTLISEEEYLSNPFYQLQRIEEQAQNQLRSIKDELNMYKHAFEKLKKNKKLSKEKCFHGPCQKSELGICDGECDYDGAC